MNLDLWPREKTIQNNARPYNTIKIHTRPQYVDQGHVRSYMATDGREHMKQFSLRTVFVPFWTFLLMITPFQQEQKKQQSFFNDLWA